MVRVRVRVYRKRTVVSKTFDVAFCTGVVFKLKRSVINTTKEIIGNQ